MTAGFDYASIHMNEENTKLKLITPAIESAGWDRQTQVFCECPITDGEIVVRGRTTIRKKERYADYLLTFVPNVPMAVIEAKGTSHSVGDGMQQAIEYATMLDVPFAYSSNGNGFLEHDMIAGTEKEISMEGLPSPDELWHRYCKEKHLSPKAQDAIITPYYKDFSGMKPRYYQRIAINRTIEAVAEGRNRILLVMATGTGKTYTAFQIIHGLRENGLANRVLYLADRNVLIDQTIAGDFKPLEKVTVKVTGRKLDSAYEVYFALYHQLVGDSGQEIFREFEQSFFDVILVDECHRGSAKKDSAWRKILEYFNPAVQIGVTATPKETKDVSNIDYFGEPLYTYSLKQGIQDGFLAPYRVIRPKLNIDVYGYRPGDGKVDDKGQMIDDKVYEQQDFDREIVIRERTQAVAKKLTQFLRETNRFSKTIVFCIDIDHAERMRQALVNENADLCAQNPRYVMRITGDNKEGKAQLDAFMDPDEKFPTIVTTSEMLTTGVNCKTCEVVVLDNVFGEQGMTKFKQIIGRGTRISEEYGKLYFTILDFRDASRMFADPDFDGEPVCVYEPADDDLVEPSARLDTLPDVTPLPESFIMSDSLESGRTKYYVHGVEVNVVSQRVEYYSPTGGLVTESLKDYTRRNILGAYEDLDHFLKVWNEEDRKQAIIDALAEEGVFLDALRAESGQEQMSDFDLICHIAYDQKPLTRSERANGVRKKGYLYEYGDVAQKVLETLLQKYCTSNLVDLTDTHILDLEEFKEFGSPMRIVKAFGGKKQYLDAVRELERELYSA